MDGVSKHLNSPDYHNIWNGEIKTYEVLEASIKIGMEKGLKSIDYQVHNRDFNFFHKDNILEILTATQTTMIQDGNSMTSGQPEILILWQRIDNIWRLGYLHASVLPKRKLKNI